MTKRILLVDDETNFRFSAGIALRKAGYEVTVAEDGNKALAEAMAARRNGTPFDLLIVDIRMPAMSGVELIAALAENGIRVPVFAMTGFSDAALMRELGRFGCRVCIEKPFRPEELVGRIDAVLA